MAKHKFENSFNPLDEIKDQILKRDIPGARFLEVERIKVEEQVRKTFSEESIKELADSISEVGLISPLTVKKIDGEENFLLIAGERRLRALKLLGETKAQVIVREIEDDKIEIVQLIENLHREDVPPLELAEGYKMLQDKYGLSLREIAKKIGKGHAYVSEIVKILDLTDEEKERIKNGESYTKFTRKNYQSVHNVDSDISELSEWKDYNDESKDQKPELPKTFDDFYGQTREPENQEPAEAKEYNEEPEDVRIEEPEPEDQEPESEEEPKTDYVEPGYVNPEEDQESKNQEPNIQDLIDEFNSKVHAIRIENAGEKITIWAEEETLRDIVYEINKKYCRFNI